MRLLRIALAFELCYDHLLGIPVAMLIMKVHSLK